jgi:uncharacterized membrane protein YkvA (DUF1232 family)
MKWVRLVRLYRIRRALIDAYRMFRNPLVPWRLKLIVAALALFILSPLNVLGDLPLLGLIDDVALLGILAAWFVRAGADAIAHAPIDAEEFALVVR